MTRLQKGVMIGLALATVVAFALAPLRTAQTLIGLCTLFYVVSTVYKFAVIRASLSPSAILRFSPEEIAGAEPREWPVYSVLVPMYKEPETLKQMVAALTAMDYPADKKDVQILLEADDDLTLNAARALTLPPGYPRDEIPSSLAPSPRSATSVSIWPRATIW
jgi:cellulose synthase/poly-beta-1,6-N-acetylglucosamine synthase-like glycosyltransferase